MLRRACVKKRSISSLDWNSTYWNNTLAFEIAFYQSEQRNLSFFCPDWSIENYTLTNRIFERNPKRFVRCSHWPLSHSKRNFLTRSYWEEQRYSHSYLSWLITNIRSSNICADKPWTWCNFVVVCVNYAMRLKFFARSLLLFF